MQSKKVCKLKKFLKVFSILFLFLIFIIKYIQYYFYIFAFKSKKEQNSNTLHYINDKYSVYINSYDGLILHGYEYKNKNKTNNWAIVVHGYRGSADNMWQVSKRFIEKGYNVIIPDNRGHGKSEGNYIGMGWHDRLDIISWINRIIFNDKDANIVLYGVSMGGATVLMVSGETLPQNVKAIISDCSYTSISDILSYQVKYRYKILSAKLILFLVDKIVKSKAGYSFKEGSVLEQVSKSKLPILFIHGKEDDYVPLYMVYKLYNAANSDKELLVIEGAEHANSAEINEKLYSKTVWEFLDKYMVDAN